MPSARHLSTSAVLVILVALLAVVPGLFLLQGLVRRAQEGQQHLAADLLVSLNDRSPHRLSLALLPSQAAPALDDGVLLAGSAALQGEAFPWKEAPFDGSLWLELSSQQLVEGGDVLLTTEGSQLVARYQERYTASAELPPAAVPCSGFAQLDRLRFAKGRAYASWSQVRELEGVVALECRGPGRDLLSGTEDDLQFTLEGTLQLRWRNPG